MDAVARKHIPAQSPGRSAPPRRLPALNRMLFEKNRAVKRPNLDYPLFVLLGSIFAIGTTIGVTASAATPRVPTITVVETLDYPGMPNGTGTLARGISNDGYVVGDVMLLPSGIPPVPPGAIPPASIGTAGFVRSPSGDFSPLVVVPGDNTAFPTTILYNINGKHVATGSFGPAPVNGGFTFKASIAPPHGAFPIKDFTVLSDAQGPIEGPIGINDLGSLAGIGNGVATISPLPGFVATRGKLTTFFAPLAGSSNILCLEVSTQCATQANSINNRNEVVGIYTTSGYANFLSFFRNSNGVVTTLPSPTPAVNSVEAHAINNGGLIVGQYYAINSPISHAIVLVDGIWYQFDIPPEHNQYQQPLIFGNGTSFNGINDRNIISGRFTDSAGVYHGFIAKLTLH